MGNLKLKGKDILKLGYPNNQSVNIALEVMKRNFATKNIHYVKSLLKEIQQNPEQFEMRSALDQAFPYAELSR